MQIDDGAKRWLVRTAAKNLWRVTPHYQLSDLIQDGFLHWCRVNNKYHNVKSMAQIMALFKITYVNHIHDLSKLVTRLPAFDELTELHNEQPDDTWTHAQFLASVAMAPAAIRQVIIACVDNPGKLAKPYRKTRSGRRETVNDRLCRMAGLNPSSIDIASELRIFLHGTAVQ